MTDQLVEILYFLSSGLLAPTLIVLMAFLALSLVMLGGLAREALDRALYSRSWTEFVKNLRANRVEDSKFFDLRLIGYPATFQRLTRDLSGQSTIVRKCLEDVELDMSRRLSRLAFGTRLGPMLGLVGTLVPLGPALTGLASGDVQALSGNLVIAFTTTVFGILVGGFAYAASVVRRGWYDQDLSDLEFVAELWDANHSRHLALGSNQNGNRIHSSVVTSESHGGADRG